MPKKTPATTTGAKKPATKGPAKTKFSASALTEKKPRNFGIGQAIQPKRDVSRFVRWPHYIKLQRQRRILSSRMKVPPSINQFTKALDKASATSLFKLLQKYRPEDKAQKKQRLTKIAEAKAKGETVQAPAKGNQVIFGLNKIVRAIESKKAKLVVLAHDVDPIELVVWIPALCRKLGIPFCIVKGKARLGTVVHHKTATALAIVNVDKDDVKDLTNLTELCLQSYNNNTDLRKQWGGGQLGIKAVAAKKKKERAVAKEEAARQKA